MKLFFLVLMFSETLSIPIYNDVANEVEDTIENNKTVAKGPVECNGEWLLSLGEYSILPNETIYISAISTTVNPLRYYFIDGKLCIEKNTTEDIMAASALNCKHRFSYNSDDYQMLPNGTAILFGEYVLEKSEFEIKDGKLKTCAPDYDNDDDNGNISHNVTTPNSLLQDVLMHAGRVGAGISIVALILHLLVFIVVPTRRNLPGYILTSMSVAFLLAYCFVQIGQIEEVLGTSCIVSASMEHFFFLSAFFWMNVMAFDVWKALRLATHKLVAPSKQIKVLRFMGYSSYAWGIPLFLAITAVAIDLSSNTSKYKPSFGHDDVCWFTNPEAKIVFFVVPAFILFVLNAIFFGLSAFMIVKNTMKDDQQQVAKRNFVLYARLGLIMGVTWLTSIAGVIFDKKELWLVFDILNSLQGLFIFLLFSCNKKTWDCFRKHVESIPRDSTKSATFKTSSKSEYQSNYM